MKIVAISAGLGQPSSTRLLADRLIASAEKSAGEPIEATVIELRDIAHDLVNQLLTGVAPASVTNAIDEVLSADGLIVVSPIFNASFSGLFKMFFDVLDEGSLRGVPVLLAATGGTSRHSLAVDQAMLPLFFYLKAHVVPTSVFAATDDWGGSGAALDGRVTKAASELVALIAPKGDAPKSAQAAARRPEDDFALPNDFEAMMGKVRGGGRL